MEVLILVVLMGGAMLGMLRLGLGLLQVAVLGSVILLAWIAIDLGPAALERRIPGFIEMVRPYSRLIAAALTGLIGGEVLRRLFLTRRSS